MTYQCRTGDKLKIQSGGYNILRIWVLTLETHSAIIPLHKHLIMDYKPYSPEWHRKRYLKEALDKYFDDYVENEVIHGDLMDILSDRMSVAVSEVNKVMDLKDKLKYT